MSESQSTGMNLPTLHSWSSATVNAINDVVCTKWNVFTHLCFLCMILHWVPLKKASDFSFNLSDRLMKSSTWCAELKPEGSCPSVSIQSRKLWVIFSYVPADWCRMAGVICWHHLSMKKGKEEISKPILCIYRGCGARKGRWDVHFFISFLLFSK